jgi:hypothetical protein
MTNFPVTRNEITNEPCLQANLIHDPREHALISGPSVPYEIDEVEQPAGRQDRAGRAPGHLGGAAHRDADFCLFERRCVVVSWLLPSSAARSLRILIGRSLDDRVRIRSDRAVLRVPSQLPAAVTGLAARAMRALHNAFRPSGVGSGFVADLTRSRAELIAENALLRQQLIVASRAVKRPAFRVHERALLVLLARFLPKWRHALLLVKRETVLRWHREGFRLFWRRKSCPSGPRETLLRRRTFGRRRDAIAFTAISP